MLVPKFGSLGCEHAANIVRPIFERTASSVGRSFEGDGGGFRVLPPTDD